MFKLKTGYLATGIITGLILFFSFLAKIPDNKLHLVFCNVGQGDAIYIRFPDGRDMLVDGGPNNSVLQCLGKYMPFWDKKIDMVILTHPERDHMQGLVSVLSRFQVSYLVRSDITNDSEGFRELLSIIKNNHISEKLVTAGEKIDIGDSTLSILWPNTRELALVNPEYGNPNPNILGAQNGTGLNDASVVLWLRYGNFDALLPGDNDTQTSFEYRGTPLADDQLEVLKVPHHGSKTGLNQAVIDWLHPQLAIISVGKNSFGHPTSEILNLLNLNKIKILRTDQAGDIEIISDGINWKVE